MKFELGDQVQLVKLDATKDTTLSATGLHHYFLKTGQVMAINQRNNRYLVMFEKEIIFDSCEYESVRIWVPGEWLQYVCVPEKPKEFTGKAICVSDDVDNMRKKPCVPSHFTPGKVYSIKQGVLFDDLVNPLAANDGLETPFDAGIRNIDEFNKKMARVYPTRNLKFIEFKGFANE